MGPESHVLYDALIVHELVDIFEVDIFAVSNHDELVSRVEDQPPLEVLSSDYILEAIEGVGLELSFAIPDLEEVEAS